MPKQSPARKSKPARQVTDRAKRYRAQKTGAAIDWGGKKRCHYCGNPTAPLQMEHVDGIEAHGEPKNITLACRPCNTLKSLAFQRAGLGELTEQYNPGPPANIATVASFNHRDEAEEFAMRLARRGVKVYLGESGTPTAAWVYTHKRDKTIAKSALAEHKRNPRHIMPHKNPGAKSWQQWVTAVAALRGEGQEMTLAEARDIIRETSHRKRTEYAKDIRDRRRAKYGPTGRFKTAAQDNEVPF